MVACSKSNEDIVVDICEKQSCDVSDADLQAYEAEIEESTNTCIDNGNESLAREEEACNAVWRDYHLCLSNLECDEFISFLDGSDACDKEYMAWAECNGLVYDFEAE